MFVVDKKLVKIYSPLMAVAPLFFNNLAIFTRSPTIYYLLLSYCIIKFSCYSSTISDTHVIDSKKAKKRASNNSPMKSYLLQLVLPQLWLLSGYNQSQQSVIAVTGNSSANKLASC